MQQDSIPRKIRLAPERADILLQHWSNIYQQVCANKRASDDISLKLLSLVPVLAGIAASILTLIGSSVWNIELSPVIRLAAALLGFMITLGLFRWELRNISKCRGLKARAEELEYWLLTGRYKQNSTQSTNQRRWGKTQSEILIYSCVMAGWALPASLAIVELTAAM